ncbi:MAG TPA: hypothetical protein VII95_09195 [Terriglobales bacterium]
MEEKRYSCQHVVPIEQEPRHHLVIENEFVRAFAVEIAPHDRTLCHRHPNDYLLYVVGDGDVVSAARDEEPKKLSYRDGECELLQAGMVHVVENLGDAAFRNVVVELLPRADGLRRGDDPKLIAEEAIIVQRLGEERAAIFAIDLEGGSEVKVFGPALVATPYGDRLNPEEPGDITVKPNRVSDLAWIPPGCQAVLWRCQKAVEKAVIFQVGRTDEQLSSVIIPREPPKKLRAHVDEPG